MGSLIAVPSAALAVRADVCEIQRAQYPKNWNDTKQEKALFTCWSHYSGALVVKVGTADSAGRVPMSLSPANEDGSQSEQKVYRIWLDKEQAERLKQGKYFATVVRTESSCWIRGALDEATVFFMDSAEPASDTADAGSFYNKAPRFSAFLGDSYTCEPAK